MTRGSAPSRTVNLLPKHAPTHTQRYTQRLIPRFTDHHVTCRWTGQKGVSIWPPTVRWLNGCVCTLNAQYWLLDKTEACVLYWKCELSWLIVVFISTRMHEGTRMSFQLLYSSSTGAAKLRTKANSYRNLSVDCWCPETTAWTPFTHSG